MALHQRGRLQGRKNLSQRPQQWSLLRRPPHKPSLDLHNCDKGHSTPNGLNQHVVEQFRANGGHDAVLAAFESVKNHMQKLSET